MRRAPLRRRRARRHLATWCIGGLGERRRADLAAERFSVDRHWHKRVIRSGPNTLRPYQENPPDRTIEPDDIVFGDFGPGVFELAKRYFAAHARVTAAELFGEVVDRSSARGWKFGNYHCGHLVGEFPHENFDGEKIGSLIAAENPAPLLKRTTSC